MKRQDITDALTAWSKKSKKLPDQERKRIFRNQRRVLIIPGDPLIIEPLTEISRVLKNLGQPIATEARLKKLGFRKLEKKLSDAREWEKWENLWRDKVRETGTQPSSRDDPSWNPPVFFIEGFGGNAIKFEEVITAFEAFDTTGKPDGFREAQKWFVAHPDSGKPYPAKIIWGLITSQRGRDFTAHQARDALQKLGLECAKLDPTDIPPEPSQREPLFEGAERQATNIIRERNPVARRLCIDHYRSQNDGRLACLVCDADFSEIYGELGEGFIHVHHLDPLAKAKGPRDVTPEHDLVPVCPNCHAMIHRNGATRSIAEIKRLMTRSKG